MLIAVLVGIGIGIGLAAALLTYRQCRNNRAETDAQRQDALERFKIWNNFWKYFLVSFALVLITTLLGNTLKERELALQTAKQQSDLALENAKQASASLIAENTNLGSFLDRALVDSWQQQIRFASYFSHLTRDPEARKRWADYAVFIDEERKNESALEAQKNATDLALLKLDPSDPTRADLEAKRKAVQSDLDLSKAILQKPNSFTPLCDLPFDGVRSPAIDDRCGIEGGSSDPAKQAESRAKNNFCAADQPVHVMRYRDLINLQSQSKNIPKSLSDRAVVKQLGEGQYVSYVAFIKEAHYSDVARGEAANCNLPGKATNDISIALLRDPSDDECLSTTAEMSPHYRPPDWTPENLLKASAGHPVRINGQLFFDGSHIPCSGSSRPNPRRASVWEIHPVYSVEVCAQVTTSECEGVAAKWTPLNGLVSSEQE